jgi:hypothetical protein
MGTGSYLQLKSFVSYVQKKPITKNEKEKRRWRRSRAHDWPDKASFYISEEPKIQHLNLQSTKSNPTKGWGSLACQLVHWFSQNASWQLECTMIDTWRNKGTYTVLLEFSVLLRKKCL